MKVVIKGHNVSGTFAAQNIRFLNEEVEIEVFTQEKYPYYTRVNLLELKSDLVKIDDLIVFNEDWYRKKQIKLNLSTRVKKIDPLSKSIYTDDKKEPILFDRLIIASGSTPNIPPIKNAVEMKNEKQGVFTLRGIEDALDIKTFIKDNNDN
jgi:NAD(P)H-nitrite reductase large subunit